MQATRCRHPHGISLGRAHTLASFVAQEVRRTGAPIDELTPLGSLRRYAPSVDRVTLLATAPADRHAGVLDALARLSGKATVLSRTAGRIAVATERGPIEVFLATPDQTGAALAWHTGTDAHVQQLQARASGRGLLFEGARLTDGGREVPCPSENDFYRHLGLPYVRSGTARERRRDRSGRAGPAAPAALAAPHPRRSAHAHALERRPRHGRADGGDGEAAGLRVLRHHRSLRAQRRVPHPGPRRRGAVRRPRSRRRASSVPGIEVLHGVEVDIMPDGSLDFDDALLAGFDIVLASLHDDAGHGGPRLLDRYLRAVEHPLVNVITHPANRTPGGFDGYDLDYDRLFDAAAATGTAMEVDGSPGHLDLDGALARRAVEPGRHAGRGQRRPPHRLPGPAAAVRRRHRAPRLGRAPPRAEYPRDRRRSGVRCGESAAARALLPASGFRRFAFGL